MKLVYQGSDSTSEIQPQNQELKTHNMGVTVTNPVVIVNINQNRFTWEINSIANQTLKINFRNVSNAAAAGSYKVFVFEILS